MEVEEENGVEVEEVVGRWWRRRCCREYCCAVLCCTVVCCAVCEGGWDEQTRVESRSAEQRRVRVSRRANGLTTSRLRRAASASAECGRLCVERERASPANAHPSPVQCPLSRPPPPSASTARAQCAPPSPPGRTRPPAPHPRLPTARRRRPPRATHTLVAVSREPARARPTARLISPRWPALPGIAAAAPIPPNQHLHAAQNVRGTLQNRTCGIECPSDGGRQRERGVRHSRCACRDGARSIRGIDLKSCMVLQSKPFRSRENALGSRMVDSLTSESLISWMLRQHCQINSINCVGREL